MDSNGNSPLPLRDPSGALRSRFSRQAVKEVVELAMGNLLLGGRIKSDCQWSAEPNGGQRDICCRDTVVYRSVATRHIYQPIEHVLGSSSLRGPTSTV